LDEENSVMIRGSNAVACVVALVGMFGLVLQQAEAQIIAQQRQVGGVKIDADGVLSAPTTLEQRELERIRQKNLDAVPIDLQKPAKMRAVSLKRLEADVAKAHQENTPLPDEVKYLAGLQRIEFVLIYPERGDVVLVGPAEGWAIDSLGNVVGATTRRPVMLLDDLIVVLQARKNTPMEPISCSIDPTPEGLRRVRALSSRLRTIGNPRVTMRRYEEALGPQVISITGVPPTSHFARMMVAADFRMKRLAMNFEPAPVDNMPSFLHLMKTGSRGMGNVLPRWWLAPKYEPIARDAKGLAWQLRGQGVQCMTESDYLLESGERKIGAARASQPAQKWADTFTERFEELANHDSTFGQLRNIMDLAVVVALIEKEQLLERAGLQLTELIDNTTPDQYDAPRRVASKATLLKRGRKNIISTSGGVEVSPWEVVAKTVEAEESLAPVHKQLSAGAEQWWW